MMSLYKQSASIAACFLYRNLRNSQVADIKGFKRWVAPTLNELYKRRVKVGPEPIKPRSTFLEWNYDAEVFAFAKRLGEEFDRNVLKQALTSRSYVLLQEDKARGVKDFETIPNNQDLIDIGDSIISDFIKDELEKTYSEDIASAIHNYLTTEKMLVQVASDIGLKDIVLTAEFPVANSTLANTVKAVVAALKSSQDLQRAQLFVKDFLLVYLTGKDVYEIWNPHKPLEYLSKLLRDKDINEIVPRLCNQSAVNTILANYQIGLYSNKKLLGIGWGESIEIAKETAALDAIQRIYSESLKK